MEEFTSRRWWQIHGRQMDVSEIIKDSTDEAIIELMTAVGLYDSGNVSWLMNAWKDIEALKQHIINLEAFIGGQEEEVYLATLKSRAYREQEERTDGEMYITVNVETWES